MGVPVPPGGDPTSIIKSLERKANSKDRGGKGGGAF
jgi:hypothetical protein